MMKQSNRTVSFDLEGNRDVSQQPALLHKDVSAAAKEVVEFGSRGDNNNVEPSSKLCIVTTANQRLDDLLMLQDDKECFRQLSEEMHRFQVNRTRITRALFQEQERQRKAGCINPDLLREVCRGFSLLSETEACRRARQVCESIARYDKEEEALSRPVLVASVSSKRRRSTLSTTSSEPDNDEGEQDDSPSRLLSTETVSASHDDSKSSSSLPISSSSSSISTTTSTSSWRIGRFTRTGARLLLQALRRR